MIFIRKVTSCGRIITSEGSVLDPSHFYFLIQMRVIKIETSFYSYNLPQPGCKVPYSITY